MEIIQTVLGGPELRHGLERNRQVQELFSGWARKTLRWLTRCLWCWAGGVDEGPSEVGRSGCEGGEGDAGSWWESRGGSW